MLRGIDNLGLSKNQMNLFKQKIWEEWTEAGRCPGPRGNPQVERLLRTEALWRRCGCAGNRYQFRKLSRKALAEAAAILGMPSPSEVTAYAVGCKIVERAQGV